MLIVKKKLKDFKPYGLVFGPKAFILQNNKRVRNTFMYERSWFCKETNNIHHSEKAVLSCKYCKELWE